MRKITEKDIKIAQTFIAGLGVVGALVAGTIAYLDYSRKAHLQAMRGLNQAQLEVCNEVSLAAADMWAATDTDELDEALTALTRLKHSKAMIVLSPKLFNQILDLHTVAADFKAPENPDDFEQGLEAALCHKTLDIALECREFISAGFQREAGTSPGGLGQPLIDKLKFHSKVPPSCKAEGG